MIKTLLQKIGAGALPMLVPALAWAEDKAKWNLQEPHTEVARQMYDLHTIVLIICLVIFVGVFGMMFYSMIKHRKSVGHQAAHFHENTTVEIIWTVVPFFILIGMAWPATQTVLNMRDASSPDLTIKVTGYQWKWGYEYLKGEGDLTGVADGMQIYSTLSTPRAQIYGKEPKGEHYLLEVDNPLVVPVGKKVRVLSIPAIRDRVVQGALKLILEPIFEADFQPGSYGYRPKRTAHEAVARVAQGIVEEKTPRSSRTS